MKNRSERSIAPDLVRAFAICGVLLIHLTYPIYARPDFLGGATWWLAQSINALFRTAIPLFVMLSGYLLLDKSENVPKTLARTALRLVLPLVAWSVLYSIWDTFWFNSPVDGYAVLKGIIDGGANHLYFLGILINLYILLPILRVFWQHASPTLKQYFLVVSLIFGWLYTALGYFVFEQQSLASTIFTIGLPYIGYFMLGGYVKSLRLSEAHRKQSAIVWAVATVATALLGYYAMVLLRNGNMFFSGTVPYFDNYLSPNVSIAAIAAFLVLISLSKITNIFFVRIVSALAKISFGLYILHPMVMNVLDYYFSFQVDFMNYSLLSYLLLRSALVFVFTTLVSVVIIRIPIIRKLLGE